MLSQYGFINKHPNSIIKNEIIQLFLNINEEVWWSKSY